MKRPAPPFVLLDNRTQPGAGARLFHTAVLIIQCDEPGALGQVLADLQRGLDRGLHAAGFLAYEAGAGFDPRLAAPRPQAAPEPLAWFGLFEGYDQVSAEQLDAALGDLPPPPPLTDLRFHWDAGRHRASVEAVKALIAAGDAYQVNLTYPIDFRYGGDPLALYAALRTRQPVAHGAVVAMRDRTLLSISPELFVAAQGGRLTTRPMKGTAARGADPIADDQLKASLRLDPKQRAENLMITDLLRNDLSKICRPGTVKTPALFTAETYPSFHALTSTVTGELQGGTGVRQVLAALFPCGSVVGAPKIRASEIIAELEDRPRGVYCGAIGAISPDGELAFNVAIRTAVIAVDGLGRYGVGGGIVADSDPAAEYEETLVKARVLTDMVQDYQLIETLRWSATEGFIRLDAHFDRLGGSAHRLGFTFDAEALRADLHGHVATWASAEDLRVRILLKRCGQTELSHAALAAEPDRILDLGIFHVRLDGADPFLRHKTTRRAVHEAAADAATAAGLDEMVLLNREGRVADGARNSILLQKDGTLLTPPLEDGALPGVLRQTLIEAGRAREAQLEPDDLARFPLFIGNSLRGLRRARICGSGRV